MKKGLLSFLLAALTLVGCQNYDDQFDELNAKILALQSELNSVSAIQSAINDLNTKISAVQSSALTAADLAGIISDLDAVQAAVANLGDVGTEVENLNAEVDEILAALDDLLAANAVINQDLRITSDAELKYVAALVNLDPTPTVIVNGFVEVDPTFAATNTAKIDSILAITNKINTVLGNSADKGLVTGGTGLTFNELSFLDANMDISGGVVALPKLVTVGGDITLNYSGDYSFPLISRAGTITLADTAGLGAVDFSGLTTAGVIQDNSGNGTLSLANATSVRLGSISLPASITLPKAETFVTLKDGAQAAFHASIGSTVTATAVSVDMSKMTSLTGLVTLTTGGTSLTTVDLGSVASHAAGLTLSSNGSIDLGSLTGNGFASSITSPDVNLDKLATNSGTLVLTEVTVSLPELTSNTAAITASGATAFTAIQLVVGANITTAGGATSRIDIASISDTAQNQLTASSTGILAIHNQVGDLNLGRWFDSKLKTLYIGGKANAVSTSQANAITISSSNTTLSGITILDSSVLSAFTMTDAAAMVTLTTAGVIRDFTAGSCAALSTLNFGHSHLQGDGSAAATIVVTNTAVTALDMSSMKKVKTITINGNTALASITAPNPQGDENGERDFAEASAQISITITNNALKGVYDPADDGTEVTDHVASSLVAATVSSFKAFIDKFADSNFAGANVRATAAANIAKTPVSNAATDAYISNVAFNIELDSVDDDNVAGVQTADIATTFAADTDARDGADDTQGTTDDENDGGNITTYNELSLVGSGS